MSWIERNYDNYNLEKLNKYKLPVIKSINHLVEVLQITEKQERLYFSKEARKRYLYRNVNIPKRNGGIRVLNVPILSLKLIQKAINNVILSGFKMSNEANAYIKRKSILTNALPHENAQTLVKIDIKDFFPSINFKHVYNQFRFFGYGEYVSKYLSLLCLDGDLKLPQGAPTSPAISNLISIKMDRRISAYCNKKGYTFTRYADDITISSKSKLNFNEIISMKNFIKIVFQENDFKINDEKFRYFYNGNKLEVTGVIVNNRISAPKNKIREIENAIRYISKYGLEDHMNHLELKYNNYVGHLYGLANYIKMIDKKKGEVYLEELNKLNLL